MNLISIQETAKRLGVSVGTVRNLISNRKLPAIRFCARILIDPDDLDRLIENGKSIQAGPHLVDKVLRERQPHESIRQDRQSQRSNGTGSTDREGQEAIRALREICKPKVR